MKIASYTTKELAAMYNVSPRTLCHWIALIKEKLGTKIGWYWTPKQVRTMVEYWGVAETEILN